MDFSSIPIRTEADPVNVSWWNTLRAAGVAFESGVLANTTFTIANGATNQNVTGLTLDGTEFTSAKVRVEIQRTTDDPIDVMACITLHLYFKSGTWKINQVDHSEDDDVEVVFDIATTGDVGQVRYTSSTLSGGSYTGVMKWALTEKFAA